MAGSSVNIGDVTFVPNAPNTPHTVMGVIGAVQYAGPLSNLPPSTFQGITAKQEMRLMMNQMRELEASVSAMDNQLYATKSLLTTMATHVRQ
jgi:hypothetical protein